MIRKTHEFSAQVGLKLPMSKKGNAVTPLDQNIMICLYIYKYIPFALLVKISILQGLSSIVYYSSSDFHIYALILRLLNMLCFLKHSYNTNIHVVL